MSDRGYIAVARGFFEHPIFANEPFTEREAFQWMVFEAAWKARKVRRGNSVFDLKRGEFAHSERFMADAWQWSRSKVTRFLSKLVKGGMIERKSNHEASHITVCNYDKYQNSRTTDRATTEPRPNHDRTKLEPLNKLNQEKDKHASRADEPERKPIEAFEGVLSPDRAEAVVSHRKKLKKPLTFLAARLLAAKFAQCPDPDSAAGEMIANGWQGFDPSWLVNRANRANGPPAKRSQFDASVDWINGDSNGQAGENSHHDDVKRLSAAIGQS